MYGITHFRNQRNIGIFCGNMSSNVHHNINHLLYFRLIIPRETNSGLPNNTRRTDHSVTPHPKVIWPDSHTVKHTINFYAAFPYIINDTHSKFIRYPFSEYLILQFRKQKPALSYFRGSFGIISALSRQILDTRNA
jgi:hypothetical protein